MKPVVALIGRPNVGKSTLFNQLTRSRQALVADLAGLTRDRQYGDATFEEKSFIVIDNDYTLCNLTPLFIFCTLCTFTRVIFFDQ